MAKMEIAIEEMTLDQKIQEHMAKMGIQILEMFKHKEEILAIMNHKEIQTKEIFHNKEEILKKVMVILEEIKEVRIKYI